MNRFLLLILLTIFALQTPNETIAMKRQAEDNLSSAPKRQRQDSEAPAAAAAQNPEAAAMEVAPAAANTSSEKIPTDEEIKRNNSLLRELAMARRRMHPEEHAKKQEDLDQFKLEQQKVEFTKSLEQKLEHIESSIKEARDLQQMFECLNQIECTLKQFLGSKTNLSDDEIKVRFRRIILIIAERLFDVNINASINDLIQGLPEVLNENLSEEETDLAYVFMQVSSLLNAYQVIFTFFTEIKQSQNITLQSVERNLYIIEAKVQKTLVDLKDLEKYPFKRHLELVADTLTTIIHKISQNCKEVVDVVSGQDKQIIARFNRILISLGFAPIDLKVEMDTSRDLELAQDLQRQHQLQIDEEMARRLQGQENAMRQDHRNSAPQANPVQDQPMTRTREQLTQLQLDEELARRLQDEEDYTPQVPQHPVHRENAQSQRQPQDKDGGSCTVQ